MDPKAPDHEPQSTGTNKKEEKAHSWRGSGNGIGHCPGNQENHQRPSGWTSHSVKIPVSLSIKKGVRM